MTTLVNSLLNYSLRTLTLTEAHSTFDNEKKSIVRKIFGATFINMAVTVLIAYGTAENVPELLKQYRIFQGDAHIPHYCTALILFSGPYSDFTTGWFGNVGFFLTITFVLSSLSPIGQMLLRFNVLLPVNKYFTHYAIK